MPRINFSRSNASRSPLALISRGVERITRSKVLNRRPQTLHSRRRRMPSAVPREVSTTNDRFSASQYGHFITCSFPKASTTRVGKKSVPDATCGRLQLSHITPISGGYPTYRIPYLAVCGVQTVTTLYPIVYSTRVLIGVTGWFENVRWPPHVISPNSGEKATSP